MVAPLVVVLIANIKKIAVYNLTARRFLVLDLENYRANIYMKEQRSKILEFCYLTGFFVI